MALFGNYSLTIPKQIFPKYTLAPWHLQIKFPLLAPSVKQVWTELSELNTPLQSRLEKPLKYFKKLSASLMYLGAAFKFGKHTP